MGLIVLYINPHWEPNEEQRLGGHIIVDAIEVEPMSPLCQLLDCDEVDLRLTPDRDGDIVIPEWFSDIHCEVCHAMLVAARLLA